MKAPRRPLLSILVVVFREAGEIERILDNLAEFRCPEIEVVVVDGGSDDGTVETLERREAEVDYWLSEPDSGIYEAMNKAIRAARGEYLLHMNAGDRLLEVPSATLRASDADVICCRVMEESRGVFVPATGWLLHGGNTWHHQGTFYRRRSHLGYDESYRVFGDFDLNQRMMLARKKVKLLDALVATHATGGVSSGETWRSEEMRCIRQNFGGAQLLLWRAWFAVRNPWRLLVKRWRRAREVGPRRVLASLRRALMRQTIGVPR